MVVVADLQFVVGLHLDGFDFVFGNSFSATVQRGGITRHYTPTKNWENWFVSRGQRERFLHRPEW